MSESLREKYEAALAKQLDSLDAAALTGKNNEQGPLWPPKDRVALLAEIRQYLVDTKEGPKFGEALTNGGRRAS